MPYSLIVLSYLYDIALIALSYLYNIALIALSYLYDKVLIVLSYLYDIFLIVLSYLYEKHLLFYPISTMALMFLILSLRYSTYYFIYLSDVLQISILKYCEGKVDFVQQNYKEKV